MICNRESKMKARHICYWFATVPKMLNSLFFYTINTCSALLGRERTGYCWNNTPILSGEPMWMCVWGN